MAEQTDYVWDPEWSHASFIKIPTDISRQAISTIFIHKDYVKVYPLTIDATPLNYNSFFPERAGNISLNSTFINQDNLNGTRNLTQQDIQTPSHFVNEEINERIPKKKSSTKHSTFSIQFYNYKTEKPNVTTSNYTNHCKTLCCSTFSQTDYRTF